MRKIVFLLATVAILCCIFALSVCAAAPLPSKPDIGVDFLTVSYIEGFEAPSELFVGTTQRVLLVDEGGNYVTYPTYYVTKNNTTFDFDFSKLNAATGVEYSKKSVVMLEIPTGITAISNSYFAGSTNFPACLSVQIPGTVTSYGSSTFATNAVIRIVEMLDGTEPVTIGDSMFGSAWNGGANMIGYVKYPNNLVSIGNNTFGKTKGSSKVIILGVNLKSIGTGFFSEGTPESTDTFLYVSDNFFTEAEVFANLFGGYGQYHDNHLKLTIFYTGTEAQLRALIDKGLAVQPKDYIWSNNPTIVSATDYDYETHKPKSRVTATFVYGYNKCDAFYGGHSFAGNETVITQNLFEVIRIGDACTKCGDGQTTSTIAPLFAWKGYSVCTFGTSFSVTQGYVVNQAAIEEYLAYVPDFDFGVIAKVNAGGEAIAPQAGDKGVVTGAFIKGVNDYVDIKIVGISESLVNTRVVFCVYATVNGKTLYLDNNATAESVTGFSYSEILEK